MADEQYRVEPAACMILLLGDAIISLDFDMMSAVMCTEHKHSLRHQYALAGFPEESSSMHLELPFCGVLCLWILVDV